MTSWTRKLAPIAASLVLSVGTQSHITHALPLAAFDSYPVDGIDLVLPSLVTAQEEQRLKLHEQLKLTLQRDEQQQEQQQQQQQRHRQKKPQQPNQHRQQDERWLPEAKSGKTTRPHHGGGGKHGKGPGGHHAGTKAWKPSHPSPPLSPSWGVGSAKSGKSGPPAPTPTAHAIAEAAHAAGYATADEEDVVVSNDAGIGDAHDDRPFELAEDWYPGAKTGKASAVPSAGGEGNAYGASDAKSGKTAASAPADHNASHGGGGREGEAKSGKASYGGSEMSYVHDGSSSNGKSGKATYGGGGEKGGGNYAKSGKASHKISHGSSGGGGDSKSSKSAPHHGHNKGHDLLAHQAKSGKATSLEAGGTTKPKSDKGTLTTFFVKEPGGGGDAKSGKGGDAKSGKGGDAKSGKGGDVKSGKDGDAKSSKGADAKNGKSVAGDGGSSYSGKSGKAVGNGSAATGWGGTGGKVSKSTPMSYYHTGGGGDSRPAASIKSSKATSGGGGGLWPTTPEPMEGPMGAPPRPSTPDTPSASDTLPILNAPPSPMPPAGLPSGPLLTMPPTMAESPLSADETPETPSSSGQISTSPDMPRLPSGDDPLAKWWPREDPEDEDLISCKYSSDYSELDAFEDADFQENWLFDTRERCCDAFPNACSTTATPTVAMNRSPPAPATRKEPLGRNDDHDWYDDGGSKDDPGWPTYSPTIPASGEDEAQLLSAQGGENTVVLEPFGIKLYASLTEPNWDEEVVTEVTKKHLVHSFRSRDWEVDTLKLMLLEKERHLIKHSGSNVASQTSLIIMRSLAKHPVYDLIFGGVLYFPGNTDVPDQETINAIMKRSFEGERLDYYVELLQEAGLNVDKAILKGWLEPPVDVRKNSDGRPMKVFNWAGLGIGLASAFGGIGLIAVGSRVYQKHGKRQVMTADDLDIEKGSYAIRLQYTNDEIEVFPGSTIAETMSGSQDLLSVPSLVRGDGREDEIDFHPRSTPGSISSSGDNSSHIGTIGGDDAGTISPLESPQGTGTNTVAASSALSLNQTAATMTRYISVFTVKKDCGNKTLEEVDLRALAIAYLSRMLRRFPNTHLLPYGKNTPLPTITNIRNIPDDLEELKMYVGNARICEKTGKVLFNLRVESDQPVSRMKSSGGGSRFKPLSKGVQEPVPQAMNTTVRSSDEMEAEEMPRSPGTFEDIKL